MTTDCLKDNGKRMEYKGYLGSVKYNDEDKIFYGRVEYICSLISYEGYDVESLRNSFREAVDDYIELAHTQNIEPEQPFKGSFKIGTISDRCQTKGNQFK